METPIVVPQLGTEIREAEVFEWLKAVGDTVEAGEQLVVIWSPKVTIEVEAPTGGTLKAIVADAGELVEVGATLGVIAGNGSA